MLYTRGGRQNSQEGEGRGERGDEGEGEGMDACVVPFFGLLLCYRFPVPCLDYYFIFTVPSAKNTLKPQPCCDMFFVWAKFKHYFQPGGLLCDL